MYTYKKEELDPKFYDAVLLCELMGMKWDSLFMDKNGELCITFFGKLAEKQVKTVLMHFMDIIYNDTNLSEISTIYSKDYEYTIRGGKDMTYVFTPDGLNYKEAIKSHAVVQA